MQLLRGPPRAARQASCKLCGMVNNRKGNERVAIHVAQQHPKNYHWCVKGPDTLSVALRIYNERLEAGTAQTPDLLATAPRNIEETALAGNASSVSASSRSSACAPCNTSTAAPLRAMPQSRCIIKLGDMCTWESKDCRPSGQCSQCRCITKLVGMCTWESKHCRPSGHCFQCRCISELVDLCTWEYRQCRRTYKFHNMLYNSFSEDQH